MTLVATNTAALLWCPHAACPKAVLCSEKCVDREPKPVLQCADQVRSHAFYDAVDALVDRSINEPARKRDAPLAGRHPPEPSVHVDKRMHLTLENMQRAYDPPIVKATALTIVECRTHASMAEQERGERT